MTMGDKWRCAALLGWMLSGWPAAWADDGVGFGETWGAHVNVSYSDWDGLGDVQPAGRGGPFETSGVGIEFGGYTSVGRWGPAQLLVGAELGFMGFNSDVIFEQDPEIESAMETTSLTTSLTFRFGDPGGRYLDLDVGLGWYQADTMYIDCAAIPACFSADVRSSTAGSYLGVSGMVGHNVVLGARIHIVDFDPIEAVGPGTGSLQGPIFSIYAGWEFSSWLRQ